MEAVERWLESAAMWAAPSLRPIGFAAATAACDFFVLMISNGEVSSTIEPSRRIQTTA
jgi:hypothetical protein